MLDDARIAKYHRMRGNIYIYITIWCYQHIIANGYISYDSRIDTYPNSIANCWTTFSRTSIRLSYNNTFMYITIATYLGSTIDGYIICMAYINTPPIGFVVLISNPLRFAHRRNKALYRSFKGAKDVAEALR